MKWFLVWIILGDPVSTVMPSYASCMEEAKGWPGAWCELKVETPVKNRWKL